MPMNEIHITLRTRKYFKRAIDGHRQQRQVQLVGQLEGSALEATQTPVPRAGTLWKDNQRDTSLENLTGTNKHLGSLLGSALLVNKDKLGSLAGFSDERHVAQLFLQHPFEMASEETIDEEDVKTALMVGNDDVALSGSHILQAFDMDGQQENADDSPRPPSPRIVAPPGSIEQRTADNDHRC